MTKDDARDLKSLLDEVVRCELEAQRATHAKATARYNYDNALHRIQQESRNATNG